MDHRERHSNRVPDDASTNPSRLRSRSETITSHWAARRASGAAAPPRSFVQVVQDQGPPRRHRRAQGVFINVVFEEARRPRRARRAPKPNRVRDRGGTDVPRINRQRDAQGQFVRARGPGQSPTSPAPQATSEQGSTRLPGAVARRLLAGGPQTSGDGRQTRGLIRSGPRSAPRCSWESMSGSSIHSGITAAN